MNLDSLENNIISCEKCSRLVEFRNKIAQEKRKSYMDWEYWGKAVPGYGSPKAKLMILGLAPAAHGGNRTGRVFTGDKSADFLFKSLHHVGLANQANSDHRNDGLKLDGYITAAVKCVPPGDKPTAEEKETCEYYLNHEFQLLKKLQIVIGLGKIGFDSCLKFVRKTHPLKMKDFKFAHGVRYQLPNGLILFGSFHPSPRNVNTKKLTFEMMVEFLETVKKEL
ncbi:MAG: uracil-DNA glycosylase [Candidatus Marinimicrobia bacterium]|jgi:uracil-DNA glycosylase family 4|nr:uracil-DNA glycosylase [Candidatus Neomarinimicrobiota bacterium]MBT3502308.1 uracil-DNA glycosylase [Candidatus Neomarinimicrobiota bacterium]MBT3840410.1 uracil-DNA glycosylase [Candidatus Neomarinimicrobiota bacterium]MBT3999475.1 uracil-DNA glycosylase [Candidatus Neomarinimicrobiota bacterium]MBT4282068.1 uracil-DNA glycosylase [Candidatus Neomarinimicrobiota bacterium]